ncbi:MAG: hypothetical protein RJA36_459 [Pseudomonadota bacterium]|jgi:putrescine transport system substrate-binding protein
MIRRSLLLSALAAVGLIACDRAGQGSAAEGAQAEVQVLNIYNWPDYIPEDMIGAFEEETGIRVNYDTFETNEALHAKLVAGNTGYDLVVPGAVFARAQIEGGLLQPLDKSRIRNLANLDPAVMKILEGADPGNRYLIPWGWSFTTVGINRNKVAKALGGTPMPADAWDLVFDPAYTARLRSCGIAYLDSPTEILPAALRYIGRDPYSSRPADYRAATAMLSRVRRDIRLFSSTMIDDIAGGKACVVVGWAGDINIAAARAREIGSGDVIEALLPASGALSFFDAMALTRDARHVDNAYKFIEFYLRPENAARMANEMSYNTGNRAALPLLRPEIAGNRTIFVEPSYLPRLVPPRSFSNEARQAMASAYNAFKQGR